ncbi:biotin--[acetyl-CoA-carboxylase] ligase [Desulforhopalus sp. IMCC35007]|uniref:biotin--[acetyl-CoA-carboxylase] ligase n=1 Tax=Desulforhopalus sp. IMCC35007 TaxID=2569543 RepID=UPI0010AE8541|nr:biotin--[acetyl-CoA-carboxylase] ligase [Desulforhopalus sp. IMCC35007]TKB12161.1 biotin--[acetyl-CoA-carboxylase] ligase [Desulforhopalus sp. IMCC35007]
MLPIFAYTSIDSTNIKAKELASTGAANGTMVIADYQTQGRGRLGKDWLSSAGRGLYCSIIVRPKILIDAYPQITLVAGVALAQYFEQLINRKIQLKWPNDIFIGGRKCAGILTESALPAAREERYAVIGIGININHKLTDFPQELRSKVTSLYLQKEMLFDIATIGQEVRDTVLEQLSLYEKNGLKHIIGQWKERDFLKGKKTQWVSSQRKLIVGTALGIDDKGLLYVEDEQGAIHEVLSGDVQLAEK